jgi:hypothetical protein
VVEMDQTIRSVADRAVTMRSRAAMEDGER